MVGVWSRGRVVAWPLSVVMRIWHLSDCAECAERGDVERRGVCCREREGQSLGNFLVFAKHLPPRRYLQGASYLYALGGTYA